MFDVGFSEVVLIALLALIVLGPKRLPEAARIAGQWMGKVRRFVTDVKQDFGNELHSAELNDLYKLKNELDETRRIVQEAPAQLMGYIEPPGGSNVASIPEPTPVVETTPAVKAAPKNKSKKKVKKTSVARTKHGRTRKTERNKRG